MINDFGIYLTNIRGYGANTVAAYVADVRAFAQWAKDNIKDARWSKILREDIDHYMSYLIQQGRKASTINRTLSSISAFYRFLKRSGYDVDNPCKYESRLLQEQTTPNIIQEDELREAYEASTGVVRTIIGVLANNISDTSAVNANITSLFTFVMFAVAPFNLLKGVMDSVIVLAIYKKISPILKSHH